jgi:hypothetical protein
MGSSDSFPKEVKLSSGNHVLDIRDVVENVSDFGILYLLFLYMHHVDGHDMLNALVQRDLKFVGYALPEESRLTTLQE